MFRTDTHNNPAAFTTDVAHQAGLAEGIDYTVGDSFQAGELTYHTARLIGDPVALTIRVIDKIGYKTRQGVPRWSYICLPNFVWKAFTPSQKRDIVGYHYYNEKGTAMMSLFPNYGQQ